MALYMLATPVAGAVISRTGYINEFNQIYDNAVALLSPLTANIDANNKELTNASFETLSATPSTQKAGRPMFLTVGKQFAIDDGAQIRFVPMLYGVSQGDIPYATSSSQFGKLTIGSAFQILQATSSVPAWTSTPQLAGLNVTGSVQIGGGSNITQVITASGSCIWPAFNAAAVISTTIGVTGVTTTNGVVIGVQHSAVTAASFLMSGRITGSDTVTVDLYNGTGAVANPGSGTLIVTVMKHV